MAKVVLMQEWQKLLDLLGSSERFEKAVLAYRLWLAAPEKITYGELARLVGYDRKQDRRVLHKQGRRLVGTMLALGFQDREGFRTPSKKKRWDPDKQKLTKGDWKPLVGSFLDRLADDEALDLLLEELRRRGYDVKRMGKP